MFSSGVNVPCQRVLGKSVLPSGDDGGGGGGGGGEYPAGLAPSSRTQSAVGQGSCRGWCLVRAEPRADEASMEPGDQDPGPPAQTS